MGYLFALVGVYYNKTIKQKGSDTISSETQIVINSNIINSSYSEQDAIYALYVELKKGIQSMKNGEVYTIEEAWEEIDKI